MKLLAQIHRVRTWELIQSAGDPSCHTELIMLKIRGFSPDSVLRTIAPASAAAQEYVGLILPTATQLARELDTDAISVAGRLTRSQPRRDSLKNGTLIGMVVGAAALGVFALFLTRTDEACGCEGDILQGAALGAALAPELAPEWTR